VSLFTPRSCLEPAGTWEGHSKPTPSSPTPPEEPQAPELPQTPQHPLSSTLGQGPTRVLDSAYQPLLCPAPQGQTYEQLMALQAAPGQPTQVYAELGGTGRTYDQIISQGPDNMEEASPGWSLVTDVDVAPAAGLTFEQLMGLQGEPELQVNGEDEAGGLTYEQVVAAASEVEEKVQRSGQVPVHQQRLGEDALVRAHHQPWDSEDKVEIQP
jgi:hypothetical protein